MIKRRVPYADGHGTYIEYLRFVNGYWFWTDKDKVPLARATVEELLVILIERGKKK